VLVPAPTPKAELLLSLTARRGLHRMASGAGGGSDSSSGARWARALSFAAGTRTLDPAWPGGPGSAVADGLAPGTAYDVVASAEGVPRFLAARLRTLVPPEGRLVYRFATVSDVHIGEKQFGVMGRIHDPLGCYGPGACGGDGCLTFPERALRAAIDEAVSWGAQLLVVKGDLTRNTAPAEVRDVGALLGSCPVPVEVILGNHDNQRGVDVRGVLESEGISVPWHPKPIDLPGVRLVMVNTPHSDPRRHAGEIPADLSRRIVELVGETAGSGRGAWVGLHHPPEMRPYRTVYPPGVPYGESRLLLSSLAAVQPATMVSAGHRHRNRRYDYGPVVISEVGSTKDYPGCWAGYRVFEGGLVQVVRRTARPDVMSWTEATRRAVNGQWSRWSPGRLEDRCFAVDWRERSR